MAGSLSAALIQSVCLHTARQSSLKSFHARADEISSQANRIENLLLVVADEDADLWTRVIYHRIERDKQSASDLMAHERHKAAALEAERPATELLFDAFGHAKQLTSYADELYENGWPSVRGETGLAMSLALTSAGSAMHIAKLNLRDFPEEEVWAEKWRDRRAKNERWIQNCASRFASKLRPDSAGGFEGLNGLLNPNGGGT